MDYVDRHAEGAANTPVSEADSPGSVIPPAHEISRRKLVNRLNHINFKDDVVHVNFTHPKYDRRVTRKAYPQACVGNFLVCLWSDTDQIENLIQTYKFEDILVPNGAKIVSIPGPARSITHKGICLALPAKSIERNEREIKRHHCEDLTIQLRQNGIQYNGRLVDFNAMSFHVQLSAMPPQTFQWINPKTRANVTVNNGHGLLYSGECRIVRQTISDTTGRFVLEPLNHVIQRYKPKEYRSKRFHLTPSPDMIFTHPFTHKTVTLKVFDLAGSGFAVEDDRKNSILMPGMIIPELELNFANSFRLKGKAQVVYRKPFAKEGKNKEWIKCGIALLDMAPEDHRKLLGMLQQVENRHAYVCNKVDLDDLWQFFFETGFIYPKKYAFFKHEKETIKATYEKLYLKTPDIARHFIYQENNAIRGHMSMLRFYQDTWLIQHHAARSSSMLRAGLVVLDQIGRFTYESHRLYSNHMRYLMCFYRPDNTFPQHVFGGAADHIADNSACSVDFFTYDHYRKTSGNAPDLPPAWKIVKAEPDDLIEFEGYYSSMSGGLLIQGLDLMPDAGDRQALVAAYQKAGLTRERRLYALKHHARLIALFMLDMTDIALNMSDLTSCIKCFIIEHQALSPDILFSVFGNLARHYDRIKIPYMIFPKAYADLHALAYEKQYCLWLLNTDYSDSYFKFIDELSHLRKEKGGRSA